MHIPVNPLQAPVLAAVLAATVILFVVMLSLSLRKKSWRRFTAPIAVLAVVAAAIVLGHGIVERNEWRRDTAASLEKLYGVKLEPKATSDVLIRHQTVDATAADGTKLRVKLVGDYQDGGRLESNRRPLPELK